MKYIVELRTTRRYESVEAASAIEAVMAVKRNPDFAHTHVEENADVIVLDDRGQRPTVLTVYTPRHWDEPLPVQSPPSFNTGAGRI